MIWTLISTAIAPYRNAAIVAALLAAISFAGWAIWSTADTIGDARELKVITRDAQKQKVEADAEVAARNKVRECHARGTGIEWLYDNRLNACVFLPADRGGTGGGANAPASR